MTKENIFMNYDVELIGTVKQSSIKKKISPKIRKNPRIKRKIWLLAGLVIASAICYMLSSR